MSEQILKVRAVRNRDGGRIEVGMPNGGGFAFGMTAEVWVSTHYASDLPEVEVSMGAIGSHSFPVGRQRAAAYLAACEMAETIQAAVQSGTDPGTAVESWDGYDGFTVRGV
jgi:hypothetical protein